MLLEIYATSILFPEVKTICPREFTSTLFDKREERGKERRKSVYQFHTVEFHLVVP